MKVLIISNMYPTKSFPYYGIFVKEQIEAIHKYYPDISFRIYNIRGNINKLEYIKSLYKIYQIIEREEVDLIHVHYGLSGLFLLNPFKKIKIPIILTLHGGDIQAEQGKWFQLFLVKHILKRVNHVITLNKKMDKYVKRFVCNSTIIPCSVDTDFFTPIPSSINNTTKSNSINIIFPSSHNRAVKNYPLFQKTIQILQNKYKLICNEIELKDMNREQIRDEYRNADIMLMTSISEGSPQVIKEAMACNLPIVTTLVGDVDYLLDGVANSGWVFPHDENLLAEKTYDIIESKAKGINSREKIFKLQLDAKNVSTNIVQIYTSLYTHNSNKNYDAY